jgi:hypothetical protein
MFDDAGLVHRYSRADDLRDGVLIDVSAAAREAGIRFPVALILSRTTPLRRLRWSMCPKQIGGSAVRAEVWQTDARKS